MIKCQNTSNSSVKEQSVQTGQTDLLLAKTGRTSASFSFFCFKMGPKFSHFVRIFLSFQNVTMTLSWNVIPNAGKQTFTKTFTFYYYILLYT